MSDYIPNEPEYRALAPVARTFWMLRGLVPLVVIAAVAAVIVVMIDLAWVAIVIVIVAVFLAIWWAWLVGRRYRAWGYAEQDKELIVRHGVWLQRLSVVPYGRMQFIDVYQGPIDRWLGVATVQLHTAAAASDASIPFVDEAEARRLRERLTELGESHARGL